jgi:hypothetical protein
MELNLIKLLNYVNVILIIIGMEIYVNIVKHNILMLILKNV